MKEYVLANLLSDLKIVLEWLKNNQIMAYPENSSRSLRKVPLLHPISWCGNFVESHSFHIVSGDSPETMRKLCLSTKFPHQEIRWITVFYAVDVTRETSSFNFWYMEYKTDVSWPVKLHWLTFDKKLTSPKYIQERKQLAVRQLQEHVKIYNINPETL